MYRLMNGLIASAAVLAALFAFAVPARADYISDIQANDTTGALIEINDVLGPSFNPVVLGRLSTPGTVHGRTYTSWAFYLNDNTGGVDVFSPSSTLSALGYTPHLGDTLDLKGTYEPFDGFPEVSVITQATLTSTGNTTVPPVTGDNLAYVISDFANNSQTVGSTTIGPNDLTAQLVTMSNVWLSGTGSMASSFGTANTITSGGQTYLNDSSGSCASSIGRVPIQWR